MRILVTGAGGFVGGHLVPVLQQRGHEIVAPGRDGNDLPLDVTDAASTAVLVDAVRPEAVVHLAAQSSVARSWEDPARTCEVNVLGTLRLLDAVRRHAPEARVLSIGSGEEYGTAGGRAPPWDEDAPCTPLTPYGTSKLAQGQLVLQAARRHGLAAIHVRPFNHLGTGQGPGFAATDFCRQIVAIERGLQPPCIRVGNLATERDFLDVRDVVAAYAALLERGEPGRVYNVGSGRPRPIRDLLDALVRQARVRIEVEVDAARLRPAEVPCAAGRSDRLRQAVDWRPRIDLETTLAGMLDEWRQRPVEPERIPG